MLWSIIEEDIIFMKRKGLFGVITWLVLLGSNHSVKAQNIIPIDTMNWEIKAQSYIVENYKGENAIYIQNGQITLKEEKFINGTIEFDVYLTERQSFPGVFFRQTDDYFAETFFLRPHLSGKPDANQGSPIVNGIQAFQLYFGEAYSVAYDYNFSDWTHVKVVVNGKQAQAYLDYSDTPNLSSSSLTNSESSSTVIFSMKPITSSFVMFAIILSCQTTPPFEPNRACLACA